MAGEMASAAEMVRIGVLSGKQHRTTEYGNSMNEVPRLEASLRSNDGDH
jgi:hypothetical protein